MKIVIDGIGKKFHNEWIFKDFSYTFELNKSYAIIGSNGSGKSTLLQVIAGIQPTSAGKISYLHNNETIEADKIFKYLSLASPYMELIEDLTLKEHIDFHKNFKPLKDGLSTEDLISFLRLDQSTHKYIKNFSSGMKQRLKLGLAFFTKAPVLFLDEPTSNLDKTNIEWYQEQVTSNKKDRILIIASNQTYEYEFCHHLIKLS